MQLRREAEALRAQRHELRSRELFMQRNRAVVFRLMALRSTVRRSKVISIFCREEVCEQKVCINHY